MESREKGRSQSTQPVARRSHPALIALLLVSLIGNAVLAAWMLRENRPAEVSANAATPTPTPTPVAKPSEAPLSFDLTPYAALGSFMAENNHIPWLHWTAPQFEAFQRGLRASYEGHTVPMDDESIKLRDQISAIIQSRLGPAKTANPVDEYFQNLREKENVQQTKSGLHYRITEVGKGDKPDSEATVVVSYAARLPTGESLPMLSRARVRTAVRDLLPGLAEGVQLMMPGGKALVYLPPSLSFGNGEWPAGVPKGAPIIFFLELHDVSHDAPE